MRVAWILLAASLLALSAWWLAEGDESVTEADVASAPAPDADPGLRGSAEAIQQAHEAKQTEARSARAAARRGEGGGGFLVDPIEETQFALTGRVIDAAGEPIDDAQVAVTDEGRDDAFAYTEDDGRFTLEHDAHIALRFVVTADGYVPHVGPWRRYGDREHVDVGTVTLKRGLRLTGQVVDEHGEPWDGAVTFRPDDDPIPRWWRAAIASGGWLEENEELGEQGTFAFRGLPQGHYRLRIHVAEREDAAVLEQVPAGGEALSILVKRHAAANDRGPPWTVRFKFDPPITQTQQEKARVVWDGQVEATEGAWRGGVFEATLVGPGPARAVVYVARDSRSLRPSVVEGLMPPGGTRRIRLEPGHTLRGRVVGVPPAMLKGEAISLVGYLRPDGSLMPTPEQGTPSIGYVARRTALDAEGRFAFTGLPPGVGQVNLPSTRFGLKEGSRLLRTTAGDVRLRARVHARLHVTFALPAGAKADTIRWEYSGFTAAGLRHEQAGKLAAHRAHLGLDLASESASDPCVLIARADARGHPSLGPVRVSVSAGARAVKVVFPAARLARGRIVDAGGRPVTAAYVRLVPAGAVVIAGAQTWSGDVSAGDPASTRGTLSRLDGSFSLTLPPQGDWRLVATSEGLGMRDAPPPPDEAIPTVIRMIPAQRITGRLSAPPGEELDRYRVWAWPHDGGAPRYAEIDWSGFFEVLALPPGRYTVVAHPWTPSWEWDGFNGQAVAPSIAAGTRGVDVRLHQGLVTRLELVDEKGAPLRHARVHLTGPQRRQRDWPVEADGAFVVRSLWPGHYHFDIEVPGKGTHRVEFEAGANVRYVVR